MLRETAVDVPIAPLSLFKPVSRRNHTAKVMYYSHGSLSRRDNAYSRLHHRPRATSSPIQPKPAQESAALAVADDRICCHPTTSYSQWPSEHPTYPLGSFKTRFARAWAYYRPWASAP